MAIAMTVGATRIKILQESALGTLLEKKAEEPQAGLEEKPSSGQESCST
jgi:hypothetical protein